MAQVKIKSAHGVSVPKGAEELLQQLFSATGIAGNWELNVGAPCKGTSKLQGLQGIKVKPGITNTGIVIVAQPGNNTTRREYLASVSAERRDECLVALAAVVAGSGGNANEPDSKTIDIRMLEDELRALDEQKKGLSVGHEGEGARLEELDEDLKRREADIREERLRLEQEKSAHAETERKLRALNDDIELKQLELEEARSELRQDLLQGLRDLASARGLDMETALGLLSAQ